MAASSSRSLGSKRHPRRSAMTALILLSRPALMADYVGTGLPTAYIAFRSQQQEAHEGDDQ